MIFSKFFHRFSSHFEVKKNLSVLTIILVLAIYFKNPSICAQLARNGLLQWYHEIIPVLFPFMIFTSVIRYLNIDQQISKRISFLQKIFTHISPLGHYIIVLGFLCGFPMGAKLIRDYKTHQQISKSEAQVLLCFCNNLSPAFLLGFVYPILRKKMDKQAPNQWVFLFILYGVPLLYGFLLQKKTLPRYHVRQNVHQNVQSLPHHMSLPKALDFAITDNIMPIIKIGGYMIIFQIINILPYYIGKIMFTHNTQVLLSIMSCFLEITGGTILLGDCSVLTRFVFLPILFFFLEFGGLSCIMQTYTFLSGTDLSLKKYIFHKTMIGLISGCCIVIYFLAI